MIRFQSPDLEQQRQLVQGVCNLANEPNLRKRDDKYILRLCERLHILPPDTPYGLRLERGRLVPHSSKRLNVNKTEVSRLQAIAFSALSFKLDEQRGYELGHAVSRGKRRKVIKIDFKKLDCQISNCWTRVSIVEGELVASYESLAISTLSELIAVGVTLLNDSSLRWGRLLRQCKAPRDDNWNLTCDNFFLVSGLPHKPRKRCSDACDDVSERRRLKYYD